MHDHLFLQGEQVNNKYLGSWVLKRDILSNEILPLHNNRSTAKCSRPNNPGWLYKRKCSWSRDIRIVQNTQKEHLKHSSELLQSNLGGR